MARPRVFHLHFNRFGQKRGEKVWTVHLSDRCIQTKKVICGVPLESVYKGDAAPQPRAYFKGRGTIHMLKDRVEIR